MTDVPDTTPTTLTGPHPALRSLDPLVGAWTISGPGGKNGGRVRYEWSEGGGFLVQHIDLLQDGQPTRGVEYIGYHKDTDTLRSHYFSTTGETLEYVYELADDTLTIWFGEAGSPAKYTGRFTDDGSVNTGGWTWPGGGFESTMTRERS
jgi:hypothetical protein